jgi:hypothetical protein
MLSAMVHRQLRLAIAHFILQQFGVHRCDRRRLA